MISSYFHSCSPLFMPYSELTGIRNASQVMPRVCPDDQAFLIVDRIRSFPGEDTGMIPRTTDKSESPLHHVE